MKNLTQIFGVLTGFQMLFGMSCWADVAVMNPSEMESSSPKLKLLQFRFTELSYFQLDNGFNNVFTQEFSWNPEYILAPKWSLTGHFGVSPMYVSIPFSDQKSSFLNLKSILFGTYQFGQFRFEFGPGAQLWLIKPQVTMLSANANVHFRFSKPLLYVFDSMFVGFSHTFQKPASDEVRFGVQIRF